MRTLLDQMIDRHGETLGRMLFNAERDAGMKAHALYEQQQAELQAIVDAIELKRALAMKRLEPLAAAAAAAYDAYLQACARAEEQKVEDNRAIAGLTAKRHELLKAMNPLPFADRVQQWQKVEMPQVVAG